jgi:hypothetical protein
MRFIDDPHGKADGRTDASACRAPLKDTIESSLRPGQHVCHFGSEIGSTTELSEQFTVQLLKVAAPKPRSLLLVASGLVVSAVRQMH